MQEFTQSGGVRPFGVSLLIAGYDDNGPKLYQVDPSGWYFSWKASAMWKNVSKMQRHFLRRDMLHIILCHISPFLNISDKYDATHTAILTLKEDTKGKSLPATLKWG